MSDPRAPLLQQMVAQIPYLQFLGIRFDRAGDELTGIMPYSPHLIGNPMIPALHGGTTAAFLELTAIVSLVWASYDPTKPATTPSFTNLPKTIDITVDYLRSGAAKDSFARAKLTRQGRRYASVHVECWQDDPSKLFAQATGHFLMPEPLETSEPPRVR